MRIYAKHHAKLFRVELDGVDISADCTAADSEQGWACCLVRNEAGKAQYDPERDEVKKEVRRGVVKLHPTVWTKDLSRGTWRKVRALDHVRTAALFVQRHAERRGFLRLELAARALWNRAYDARTRLLAG